MAGPGARAIIPTVSAPSNATSASAVTAPGANARGIRLMIAAMACFVVNDALVKLASASMPSMQLICVRGAMASLWVLAVAHATGATLRPHALAGGWVARRAAIDAVASVTYLVSLFHLPIADATAINMASPLFIVALAGPLAGERVDARRWLAVAVGFAGVLLIVRPGGGAFDAFALLCLFATLLHALRDLATRRIPADVPSIGVTLATAIAVTGLAGLLSIPQGWQPFGMREAAMLAAASAFLAAAYHLIIRSVRTGDVSVVAPFRYTGLLWALAIGWVVWGDVPDPTGWAGIAVLLGAGLYLASRERAR